MPKKIKTKIKKKGLFNKSLFRLVAAALMTGCAVLVITIQKDCSDKEKELDRIQAKIDAYTMENEGMQRTLDSDDLSAYLEKVALEERGYAYPNERRFYDTSRD